VRPLWSGALTFGLVSIPVKLYTAVETHSEARFRLLDAATSTPIKEVRVNPDTGKEIPWEHIVHGVEYAKGKYVGLSSEELRTLPLASAHAIELLGFVDPIEIDPVYIDRTYYLGPGPGGGKPYELFRKALEEKKKAGIGKVTIRTREHLAAVHPQGRVLAMQTLFYADEVRSADTVPDLPNRIAIHANEQRMASQLIESMTMEFDPTEYRSEYKQALKRLVKARLEGKQLPPPKAGARVIDLQEALRASLKSSRAGRRARNRAAS